MDRAPYHRKGRLAGVLFAIFFPIVAISAVLVANRWNPQCGALANSGGCGIGTADKAIVSLAIGAAGGLMIWIAAALYGKFKLGRD